jgi:trans-L-3-hydroxyproline dehydratase
MVDAPQRSRLKVVDMHTAGEPVRIVIDGYPQLKGKTLLEKRRDARESHDVYRRRLMFEPRGHGGMYGVIPLPPTHPQAALSVLFTHAGGYSTMCGHATIAIARWAVDTGLVEAKDGLARFGLECPCGLVDVFAHVENGIVTHSGFESAPAFADGVRTIQTKDFGSVEATLAFGGAYYLILPAQRLGLSFDTHDTKALSAAGARLFAAAHASTTFDRPTDPDLAFLYGVILTDGKPRPHATRNICVFGDGQIDRSPTGSGVTARLAAECCLEGAPLNEARAFIGPTGEAFTGAAVRALGLAGRKAIIARVEGRSFYAGTSEFIFETTDPLADGFLLGQEV